MTHRELEDAIVTDLSRRQHYSAYLHLEELLNCQEPLSNPPHHDEMLFIVQHQVAELWMKLSIHELEGALERLRRDEILKASKCLARVKKIQQQLYSQWSVLETLTPSEYAEFRYVFGSASGFQSPQYRLFEILLGQRNLSMLNVYRHLPDWHQRLSEAIEAPGIYDEFMRFLSRQGYALPDRVLNRDFTKSRENDQAVIDVLWQIYEDTASHWGAYEMCESLVDVATNFQFWRFRHMKTVERIIGHQQGSGGSSGVAFLRRAIEQEFFDELIAVRTQIHANTIGDS